MPTFKFEAMDTTGEEGQGPDRGPERRRSAAEKIKQMGYFVTKLTQLGEAKGKGGKKGKRPREEEGQDLHHRPAVLRQEALHVHAAVLDAAGCRPAGLAQPQDPREPDAPRRVEERSDRRR